MRLFAVERRRTWTLPVAHGARAVALARLRRSGRRHLHIRRIDAKTQVGEALTTW